MKESEFGGIKNDFHKARMPSLGAQVDQNGSHKKPSAWRRRLGYIKSSLSGYTYPIRDLLYFTDRSGVGRLMMSTASSVGGTATGLAGKIEGGAAPAPGWAWASPIARFMAVISGSVPKYTSDNGRNWTNATGVTAGVTSAGRNTVHDDHVVHITYVGATNKIYHSSDKGHAYTLVNTVVLNANEYIRRILVLSTHRLVIFTYNTSPATAGRVGVSDDWGATISWVTVDNGEYSFKATGGASSSDRLYYVTWRRVGVTADYNYYVFRSDNYGATFALVATIAGCNSPPLLPDIVPCGAGGQMLLTYVNTSDVLSMYRSTDNGATWVTQSADRRDLQSACSGNDVLLYAYNASQYWLYVSTDAGATWTAHQQISTADRTPILVQKMSNGWLAIRTGASRLAFSATLAGTYADTLIVPSGTITFACGFED